MVKTRTQMLLDEWENTESIKAESSALAWNDNLCNLVPGASCGLNVSEIVLTEHSNPDVTDELIPSSSSNDASSSLDLVYNCLI